MQRQRGELVPIASALADLPGSVQALIPSRPTQRHYTRFDQVNQLVSASEAEADLGFMARLLALCSLPRTNPGNRLGVPTVTEQNRTLRARSWNRLASQDLSPSVSQGAIWRYVAVDRRLGYA